MITLSVFGQNQANWPDLTQFWRDFGGALGAGVKLWQALAKAGEQAGQAMRRLRYVTALVWLSSLMVPWVPAPVAQAEGTEARADFTFRRIRPPAPGEARRLVQIDPAEQARLMAVPAARPDPVAASAPSAGPAKPSAPGLFDWYWEAVSPVLNDRSDRFARALEMLGKGPGGSIVPAPRMQTMQEMAGAYGTHILRATIGTRVSPALVLAVMGVESGGRSEAVSSAGAVGLMQLIPATAERFGVSDSRDPQQNIKGGVAYLDWLLKEFDSDPVLALAAYNAGEGAVRKNDGVPPYAETRAYVPKVLAAWQVAQGLCLTPPELVTDPCVFRIISAGG